ncbi:MAG: CZB domain-containing protein [Hungatella sp.]
MGLDAKDNFKHDKSAHPDVLLKIHGELYSINSRYITNIMRLPKYNTVPDSMEGILGIATVRDEIVPLLDMRQVFKIPTLAQEYEAFKDMLEAREQDHIRWVNALEESIQNDTKFTLTTDPHRCAFGQWYDKFESDNQMINFHMRKINEPHQKLHHAADSVEHCSKDHANCTKEKCVKRVFEEVKEKYMPEVLGLLEEAKEVFQSAYSEMTVVISNGRQIGIVVDEVLSVATLERCEEKSDFYLFNHSNYICDVKKSKDSDELVLELDDAMLLGIADEYRKAES